MYSYGPLHMADQKQGDQLEPTYSSSARIRGVALRTCRKRWTIGMGGERGSGISVLMARQDDDDDEKISVWVWLEFSSAGGRCDHDDLRRHPGNYISQGRFRPRQNVRRTKKTRRRATRRYAALCSGLAPDCPRLRGRKSLSCTRLTKAGKARRI